MRLEHSFTVPAPVDTVWTALLDPARVAPCFPGATITSASGNDFAGAVKVRLGPIALRYKGAGRFTETDVTAYRTVIEASGTASGGQSTAAATVTAVLAEEEAGTVVRVATELSITGKPAQFGRGLMEDVGKKIISQFAENLADTLGPQESPAPDGPAEPAGSGESADRSSVAPPAVAPAPVAPAPVAPAPVTPAPSAPAPSAPAPSAPAPAAGPAPSGRPGRQAPAGPARPAVDEIDLLDAAGGAVAKRVVPVVGGVAVLLLIIYWLRRR